MKFTTEKIETIRDMLYLPCKIISGDVPITFSEKGISVCAMDQSHVCLVICDIPATMFTKIDEGEERMVNLNSLDFLKLLSKIKKSDNASLELKDNKLIIKQMVGKRSSRWSLNIVEPEDTELPEIEHILSTEHTTKMQLDVSYIKDAISNLEIYDTLSATFTTINDQLIISSGATNIGDFELKIGKDEMTEFESTTEKSEGMFATVYLKQICEIEKLSKKIILEYSTDAFMLIKSVSDDFKIWIMLAAKTEDDLEEEYEE